MKTVTGIVKKLAVFCMAFMMACMPAAAYASETGTGDTVTTCNVAFAVADKTASGYPGTSITVEMRDVTGTYDENYTLTQAASWGTGNTPIYTVPAPTTYNVTVSGLEDGYSVVGSDGSSEIRFAAASYGEVTLSLSIVDAGSTAQHSRKKPIQEKTHLPSGMQQIRICRMGLRKYFKTSLTQRHILRTKKSGRTTSL